MGGCIFAADCGHSDPIRPFFIKPNNKILAQSDIDSKQQYLKNDYFVHICPVVTQECDFGPLYVGNGIIYDFEPRLLLWKPGPSTSSKLEPNVAALDLTTLLCSLGENLWHFRRNSLSKLCIHALGDYEALIWANELQLLEQIPG